MNVRISKKIIAFITVFIISISASSCQNPSISQNGDASIDKSASLNNTSSSLMTSSATSFYNESSYTIVARKGDVVSTDTYNWVLSDVKVFDKDNYYGNFMYPPETGRVYIALYFDIENKSDDTIWSYSVLDYYYNNFGSYASAYNGEYYLQSGCKELDDYYYSSSNPKFSFTIPAKTKAKGCLAWSIPKEWTDFVYSYKYRGLTVQFNVSIGDIDNAGTKV